MKRKKLLVMGIISCLCILFVNAQMQSNLRPPEGTRFFDGLDPFLKPVDTTNYYGSGDVNLDGVVDNDDLIAISQIIVSLIPENPRGDVNGDGSVDYLDQYVLSDYLTYSIPLPGWWNELTTETARKSWVDKMLAIDDTNELTWVDSVFVCRNFARQLAANFAGQRIDYMDYVEVRYNWGPTRYNIPIYTVSVPGSAHAINAVLTGDDPTDFDDWYFIEPQSDYEAIPGQWNLLPGDVKILVEDYTYNYDLVKFNLDEYLTATYITSDTDLVTSRPSPPPTATPDNRKDYWNPHILNEDGGKVIFDTTREDMARSGDTDIFECELPFSEEEDISLICDSSIMGHILDTYQDQYGTTHVLYIDKPKYQIENEWVNVIGIYYGTYDETQDEIINSEPILEEENIMVDKADMATDSSGNIHVFWYDSGRIQDQGIYWTYKSGSTWQTPVNLTDSSDLPSFNRPNWEVRNFYRGLFSVISVSGNIHLAWIDKQVVKIFTGTTVADQPIYSVMHSVYNGSSWSTPVRVTPLTITPWLDPLVIIEPGSIIDVTGLTLGNDNSGNIHLVYQRGEMPDSNPSKAAFNEGRATLEHQIYNGSTWNTAAVIDGTATNLLPQMDLEPTSGALYLIREKKVNNQVKVAWSKYSGSSWSTTELLPIRENADGWYPTVKVLDSGDVWAAFSSRCPDQVTIETYQLDTTVMTVYYENHETSASAIMIRPWLKIKNDGTNSIDLENITLRYWYTLEDPTNQSGICSSATCGGNDITSYVNLDFVSVVPALTGADYYLEISFDSGAGSLGAGEETGAINLSFWKTNYSYYTQTGDYSFDASMTTFGENTNITGYIDSVLEYGDEPE